MFRPTEKHHKILPEPFLCGSLAVPAREWDEAFLGKKLWHKFRVQNKDCDHPLLPCSLCLVPDGAELPAVLWGLSEASHELCSELGEESWIVVSALSLGCVPWVEYFYTWGLFFVSLHASGSLLRFHTVGGMGTVVGPVHLHSQFSSKAGRGSPL